MCTNKVKQYSKLKLLPGSCTDSFLSLKISAQLSVKIKENSDCSLSFLSVSYVGLF